MSDIFDETNGKSINSPFAVLSKTKDEFKTIKSPGSSVGGGVSGGRSFSSKDDARKMEECRFSRAGAEITLSRINKFEELNAPDLTEGDKLFLEKTRELWKELAIHGFLKKDEQTGELYVDSNTDLDGKCCLELLKLAKINKDAIYKDLKYVAPGDYEEGRINFDTGGKHSVSIERKMDLQSGGVDWDKTAFVDHHAEESPHGNSATMFAYRMLTDLGLFKRTKKLDAMIDFVTDMDNAEYPDIENYYNNSWKTIAGLHRYISGPNLLNFFLANKNPDPKRELSEEEMKKYGFITDKKNRSENQKKVVEVSRESLEQIEKDGFIISSGRYGKIAVNVEKNGDNGNTNGGKKKNIPGDFEAVRAFGCNTLVTWDPENKKFKISSSVPITETYPQGLRVRERMWVKNNSDSEELQVSLQEILDKMTDGKLVPEGKLKEYLEGSAESKDTIVELEHGFKMAIEKFARGVGEDMYSVCIDNGEELSSDEIDSSVLGFIKRGISEWIDKNKKIIGLETADEKSLGILIKEMAEKIFGEIKKV